jgi:hypothetical protein
MDTSDGRLSRRVRVDQLPDGVSAFARASNSYLASATYVMNTVSFRGLDRSETTRNPFGFSQGRLCCSPGRAGFSSHSLFGMTKLFSDT